MKEEVIVNLIKQIGVLSVILSFVVLGIKKTIKIILKKDEKEKLNRFVATGIVYGFGFLVGFVIKNEYVVGVWEKLLFGFFVGASTIAIYDMVLKELSKLSSRLVTKIFLKDKNEKEE